ncbi:hypothetical protein MBANPS3_010495 [Mucor bainieri]
MTKTKQASPQANKTSGGSRSSLSRQSKTKQHTSAEILQDNREGRDVAGQHNATNDSPEEDDIDSLRVKQASEEKYDPQSQDDSSPSGEYDYHCPLCSIKLPNPHALFDHCESTHSFSIQRERLAVPASSEEAERSDSGYYCKSCRATYEDLEMYRQHYSDLHKDFFPKHGVIPDPSDSNNYCKACDRTYSVKTGYHAHLYLYHKIDCRPSRQPINSNAKPDMHDPNNYCRVCDKKLAKKSSYRNHLISVHQMVYPDATQDSILPDANDPHYHCRVCQKNYSSRRLFRQHLKRQHRMILEPLVGRKDPNLLPDPHNPNFYCRACTKTYANLYSYRSHCMLIHKMRL